MESFQREYGCIKNFISTLTQQLIFAIIENCVKIIEVLVLLKCCSIIYNSEKYNHLIALTCLSIIWGII